jgi:hypothetical protein
MRHVIDFVICLLLCLLTLAVLFGLLWALCHVLGPEMEKFDRGEPSLCGGCLEVAMLVTVLAAMMAKS